MTRTKLLSITICILVAASVILGVRYTNVRGTLVAAERSLAEQRTNASVVEFLRLFIVKVLRADREVDFETRLQLETAVRAIGNAEILASWKRFTSTRSEAEAQAAMKDLLELLVGAIVVR